MNTIQMVGLLSDLHNEHEKLLEVSIQKTESLKKNDMKALELLLSKENQCIQRIEAIEDKRVKEVESLLNRQGIVADENPPLVQILRFYTQEEQDLLIDVQSKLRSTIRRLQEQNELNHELTRQSLQFVNASLSIMEPKQNPAGTYKRPGQGQKNDGYRKQQSIFDSKA